MSGLQQVHNMLERLQRKVAMTIAPVIITATDDSGPVHRAQVRVNGTPERIDNVAVSQLYGFASHAMAGTDATAIFVGGDRSNVVIVSTGNQKARKRGLATGEVALYTDEGDYVLLRRGKIVEVVAQEQCTITTRTATIKASDKVRVEAPRLECTGDIIDNCDTRTHTAADDRAIYNTHTHPGIEPGGGNTGTPNQLQPRRVIVTQ